MIRKKRTHSVMVGILAIGLVAASPALERGDGFRKTERISPVLREEVVSLLSRPEYDHPIPLIVQVDPEFFAWNARQARENGAQIDNALPLVHGYTAQLTAREIRLLLDSGMVRYVTEDALLRPTGKPSGKGGGGSPYLVNLQTIGADKAAALGLDGSGVGVAMFDSGIRAHPDFYGVGGNSAVDFTSGVPNVAWSGTDNYGHGTHVAGIVAGNGSKSAGSIIGVAPRAQLLDIRVIGDLGFGHTSNLIKAIDWLIQNKSNYNVRVANLSLGHAPKESYSDDPLCQAVERLVESGVVTVVSAGNLGKTWSASNIWGGISSPANAPAVITVGAVNTRDSATQDDDIATTYGSRGSTYIDGLFKPDLSAPANHVASVLAKNSLLDLQYPDLAIDGYYAFLSGTSMAAPYVSGTVALMLQANPSLSPRMVKAILMATAGKLKNPHSLEQGNGMLNAYTAVRVAQATDVANRQFTFVVQPSWQLGNQDVTVGGAIAAGNSVIYSNLVAARYRGKMWGGGAGWGISWDGTNAWLDQLINADGPLWESGANASISDGELWTGGTFWSEGLMWSEGLLWVDSIASDGVMWVDGIMWSEAVFWADANQDFDFHGDPQ